ncbi:helix-turn-helix domain-containing protein [Candidatus Dojkabacteria bacterium]|nr:helix-turn-helix domain-containing protein [Candidatus Dojkabacteria bacterium]
MTFFDNEKKSKYNQCMDVVWIYNKNNDIFRISYTFSRIFSGYYNDRGIPLVFNNSNVKEKNVVRLPKFNPAQMLLYQKYFPPIPYDKFRIVPKIDKRAYLFIEGMLNMPQDFRQIINVESEFNKIFDQLMHFLVSFFPKIDLKKVQIQVLPTMYGTQASNDILKPGGDFVGVFIRNDATIYELIVAILTGFIQHDLQENYLSGWLETQTLVNWLIRQTSLSELIGYENSVVSENMIYKIKKGYPPEIVRQSNKLNEALGITAKQLRLKLGENGKIYFNNRVLDLNNWEGNIMRKFLENPHEVLDYYELSEILGMKDENFSLWTISKRIQRLRGTLDNLGVGGYKIQNIRGQGFILSNT